MLAKQAARRAGVRHIADQATRAIILIDSSDEHGGMAKSRSVPVSSNVGTDPASKDCFVNSSRKAWSEFNIYVVSMASVQIPIRRQGKRNHENRPPYLIERLPHNP